MRFAICFYDYREFIPKSKLRKLIKRNSYVNGDFLAQNFISRFLLLNFRTHFSLVRPLRWICEINSRNFPFLLIQATRLLIHIRLCADSPGVAIATQNAHKLLGMDFVFQVVFEELIELLEILLIFMSLKKVLSRYLKSA